MATLLRNINIPARVQQQGLPNVALKTINIPTFDKAPTTALIKSLGLPVTFYCVRVLDEDLNPVEGATIKVGQNESFTTDSNGEALITIFSGNINISKLGFLDLDTTYTFTGIESPDCLELTLITDPCLVPIPENEFNFIRWHRLFYDIPPNPLDKFRCCETLTPDFVNPFILQTLGRRYTPVIKPTENFKFYANLNNPINDSDFSEWKLALVKIRILDNVNTFDFEFIHTDLAPILQDNITGGYNYYTESFEFPATTDGLYFLLVYNSVTNKTKFISNQIYIDNTAEERTVLIKYSNTSNQYNFNYEGLPALENEIRIHLFQSEINHEINIQQYRSVSTGKLRNIKTEPDKLVKFMAHKFDEPAHDTMISLITHDNITINNKAVTPKGNYEIENQLLSPLANAEIEFYINSFSRINKNC